MRSITNRLKNRFLAQAEEAKVLGFTKVAENLENKMAETNTRQEDASYTYNEPDFRKDVESSLWNVVLRVADFHNVSIDAKEAQDLVEKFADELVGELRVKANVEHGVGAYETPVPGEDREIIRLDEDDE